MNFRFISFLDVQLTSEHPSNRPSRPLYDHEDGQGLDVHSRIDDLTMDDVRKSIDQPRAYPEEQDGGYTNTKLWR